MIVIGEEDIEKIGLKKLREKIVMIPQEPWLFSGSIRLNMDPESKMKDSEILELFDKIGLNTTLEKKLGDQKGCILDIDLTENGGNLSQGEKQLLCIARALLKRPKILIMDEATANLDELTDQTLQKYLVENMKETTILMVAHRKSSMSLCNRIIDLSNDILN